MRRDSFQRRPRRSGPDGEGEPDVEQHLARDVQELAGRQLVDSRSHPTADRILQGYQRGTDLTTPNGVERGRDAAVRQQFGVRGFGNRAQRRLGEGALRA